MAYGAPDKKEALSIGLLGNAAEVLPQLLAMNAEIDIVTDETSAHDPLSYLPVEFSFDEWVNARETDPEGFVQKSRNSMRKQVEAMVGLQDAGSEVFDYGNNIRTEAKTAGFENAFAFPGFVPAYIRPLFELGKGPFRSRPHQHRQSTPHHHAQPRNRTPTHRTLKRPWWIQVKGSGADRMSHSCDRINRMRDSSSLSLEETNEFYDVG